MLTRSYQDDPEPPDENDPAFKEEMFRTFRFMNWEPKDLVPLS